MKNNGMLENNHDLIIKCSFNSKEQGCASYNYICFVMTDGKKIRIYSDASLPIEYSCTKNTDTGYYNHSISFHPVSVPAINKYGGCNEFFKKIQRIDSFYIIDPALGYEYEDADFECIEFCFAGEVKRGFFV